jgi:hypothetical protein
MGMENAYGINYDTYRIKMPLLNFEWVCACNLFCCCGAPVELWAGPVGAVHKSTA